ncbi:hypothetical protein HVPorG_04674 [Roseomonas mucosa]|uniref:hypothetical protein n=1 Tax=Roseomonas mucosa TaxID=207340 RepID=UPI00220348DA|nr:hypothetical protein [Roseomonas mucosa]QDJ10785.1 hypothetical protein HVPorG_04674 [Roseomonas mucosa]
MARLSRRAAIGAVLATTSAAAAEVSVSPHPDAAILALRDRCLTLNARSDALMELIEQMPNGPEREAVWEQVYASVGKWHELKREMAQLPAITQQGMAAKAQVLWPIVDPGEGFEADDDSVLAWSVCRDLLGKV